MLDPLKRKKAKPPNKKEIELEVNSVLSGIGTTRKSTISASEKMRRERSARSFVNANKRR